MRRLFRRAFGSVRVRVAIVAASAFAMTLVGASVLLLRTLESRLIDDIRKSDQSALQASAVQVLTNGLAVPESGEDAVPLAGTQTIAFRVGSESDRFIVATADGELTASGGGESIASSAPTATMFDQVIVDHAPTPDLTAQPIDLESARLLGVAGQRGPFLISNVEVFPGLSLSTASSLAEVDNTLATTRMILWYAVPALVLLVAGCAWLLVGRALRPVHALTTRASTISSTSLHERVPVPSVNDEVSELASTINSMLDRIEAADIASRRLVSDASHELRTPIAVIRTELEVARRDPNVSWDDVSNNVLDEVDRLQGLVDDLLLLARIRERGVALEPFSVLDVVRDVSGRRRQVELMIDEPIGDVETVGDFAAVQRALDHVVANAARHAESRVEVSTEVGTDSGAPTITIHVDDDGPGIPMADRERALERFERLDEGRSRDAGGSGLGLAVAVDVMAAHHGRVQISDAPIGGARVSLILPHACAN